MERQVYIWSILTIVLAVAACTPPDARKPPVAEPVPETDTSGSSLELSIVPPLPENPPDLLYQGDRLDPSAFHWRTSGEWKSHYPSSDSDVTINHIDIPDESTLSFRLASASRPVELEVRRFSNVVEGEMPSERDLDSTSDCMKGSDFCTLTPRPAGQELKLNSRQRTGTVLTITANYVSLGSSPDNATVDSNFISWVVLVSQISDR